MKAKPFNLPLFLVIGLPAFAVVASVGTAVIALSSGDPPLPGQYHWEGLKLDHDFAHSQRATQLHLQANLDLQANGGACRLSLQLNGPRPATVVLRAIHGSKPTLDRVTTFAVTATQGQYIAPCQPLPPGQWHFELEAPDGSWSFRQDAAGEIGQLTLAATG